MSTTKPSYLVISTMKNEAPHIVEWLAFYKSIGFTDFLIYSNDCEDGSDLLLDRLTALGEITHVRNNVLRRGPHKSALKNAMIQPLYEAADWVFVCDADEFLNIKTAEGNVTDLIDAYPDADAIPVTWKQYSHADQTEMRDDLTILTFNDAQKDISEGGGGKRFVKTLFRRNEGITRLGLHGPIYDEDTAPQIKWGRAKDASNDPMRPESEFGYEIAQVNHYAVRSIEAFMIKRDRGRANHVNETLGIEYWDRWCLGGKNDASIARHEAAVLAQIAKLNRDPIVKHLHQGGFEWHQERVTTLLKDAGYKSLFDQICAKAPTASLGNEATDALKTKAPNRHINRLNMLDRLPKNGRGAEIGVWNGGFSGAILDITKPTELVLIDPWDLLASQNEEEWTHGRHQDPNFMRNMFDHVTASYGHLPNVNITKGFSAEVLETYPDDYFDWVYIDGNHLYDFVKKDLEVSFRKVRAGGTIAGDDFFWKRDDRMHVKDAVFDVLKSRGITDRPNRMGQQFLITVEK